MAEKIIMVITTCCTVALERTCERGGCYSGDPTTSFPNWPPGKDFPLLSLLLFTLFFIIFPLSFFWIPLHQLLK